MLAVPAAALTAQEDPLPWEVRGAWHVAAEWSASTRPPTGAELLRVAAAELAIGRVGRARSLLTRSEAARADSARALALRAMVAEADGKDAAAAALFARAARAVGSGAARWAGAYTARAAAAWSRAGAPDSAAAAWGRARALMAEIDGWLALREARDTREPRRAQTLLAVVPQSARPLALRAMAALRLAGGDTAAAEPLLAEAGRPDSAALLALARSDTAAARAHALRAVAASDTAVARLGLDVLDGPADGSPGDPAALTAAARGAARLGQGTRAARLAGLAVAAGDSGPGALVRWGEYLERAGRRSEALAAYDRAGAAGAFPRARALLRGGDRPAAIRELRAFADAHPDDPQAPVALYLAADAAGGDSLLAEVAARWPAHEYAARARRRLAADRMARADTAGALALYDAAAAAGGTDAPLARFHAGRLRLLGGDERGRAALEALARQDSLGYYGFQARALLGLTRPRFTPAAPHAPSASARVLLDRLALLDAAGLVDEAELLLTDVLERGWEDPDELLDVAEGLIAAGRPREGIRLAWRAATRLTLNHPRVVRAVFPWPDRELIEAEAAKFQLDPYLIAGLIRQESGFSASARSRAGAIGVMQLMPATARGVARRLGVPWSDEMRAVADANLHIGSAHLAGLVTRYRGDPVPAIAAYNAGGTPVTRWLRAPGADDRIAFVESITYPETQDYVRTVWRNRELYLALYGPGAEDAEP